MLVAGLTSSFNVLFGLGIGIMIVGFFVCIEGVCYEK